MKTASKLCAMTTILVLATGSAFAENPGMKSPPFYPSMTQGTPHSITFAFRQAPRTGRQADRAQASHSVVQMGERGQNSPYSNG